MKTIKLHPEAKIPTRANPTDAGLDLYSVEDQIIHPGKWALVSTGIGIRVPDYHYGMICSRSGLALNTGLVVHQGVGIIDSGYQGEVKVMLRNTNNISQKIIKGDRIAQLLICPVSLEVAEWVESFDETSSRNTGGFGSSGK
jgi:dUTP pyrophosphatase